MLTDAAAYGAAALAYFALTVLVLSAWRDRQHSAALAAACVLTFLWCADCAWELAGATPGSGWMDAFEALRGAAWSAFLLLLAGDLRRRPGIRSGAPALAGAAYLLYFIAIPLRRALPAAPDYGFTFMALARVGLAIIGMVVVEHLYRSKEPQQRWALKFACLGIGAMFAFDLYMYSDAALLRTVDPDIRAARGFVVAFSAPLVAVSAARSASWSSALVVSRRALFHSAALAGSAVYLLLMGSAGYLLRYSGGRWGAVMQLAFLFGAALLLATILFSGAARAWLRVFISKHFYSYRYDYRVEWLRFTRALSSPGPRLGERALGAIAALVDSPGAALWTCAGGGRYECTAQLNMAVTAPPLPANSALCRTLESRHWVMDLDAAEPDCDGAGMIAAIPRAWLVVPLMLHARLFGLVVLQRPRSAVALDWELIDLMKIAGTQAASYLAQQQASDSLAVARQFESFNRMSAFIVHDLKNLVSQLSLLMANAPVHRGDPAFQVDVIDTAGHCLYKMRALLQKLGRGHDDGRQDALALDELLAQEVSRRSACVPCPVYGEREPDLCVLADAGRLARVLGHLIQNAVEATPPGGSVTVRLRRAGATALIEVADTGSGMTQEFVRDRLFQPFETTKAAGMGIGVFESREYVRALGGTLEVESTPLSGTTFRIVLPLCQSAVTTGRAA